jgi:hypothetical protein
MPPKIVFTNLCSRRRVSAEHKPFLLSPALRLRHVHGPELKPFINWLLANSAPSSASNSNAMRSTFGTFMVQDLRSVRPEPARWRWDAGGCHLRCRVALAILRPIAGDIVRSSCMWSATKQRAASRLRLGGSTAPLSMPPLGRSKPLLLNRQPRLHPRVAFPGASPLSHRNSILVRQETASAHLQIWIRLELWFVVKLPSTAVATLGVVWARPASRSRWLQLSVVLSGE